MSDHSDTGPKIFRYGRVTRIALTVLGVPIGMLFASMPFWAAKASSGIAAYVVLGVVGGGLGALFLAGAVLVHRGRLELYPDRVRKVGAFFTKERRVDDFDGYRLLEHGYVPHVLFSPKAGRGRRWNLELGYERRGEILAWVRQRLPDLTAVDHEVELHEVKRDKSLGADENTRLAAIARARKFTGALNTIAGVATLWAIFYPNPYIWLLGALVVLPIVALALIAYFRDAIQFDGKPNGVRPSVAYACIGPAIALGLRAILDWNLLGWSDLITWAATLGAIITLGIVLLSADVRKKPINLIGVVLVALGWGWGTAAYVNCSHDQQPPKVHLATVVSHRMTSGKIDSYYLKVRPWLGQPEDHEVSVSRATYEARPDGSTARVLLFQGRLGAAWYVVR